ncbi:MAG: hypothetical protein M1423_01245, partial [Acidobacteria bacterium]|nr:hypothetical protein [Acidobacteriota bacterium]
LSYLLEENGKTIQESPVTAEGLAALIKLVAKDGTVQQASGFQPLAICKLFFGGGAPSHVGMLHHRFSRLRNSWRPGKAQTSNSRRKRPQD